MFRPDRPGQQGRYRFPRVRGDVPFWLGYRNVISAFSPRARGCSKPHSCYMPTESVFPACAGMFLVYYAETGITSCFPRVRGDVPRSAWRRTSCTLFSPRARGCSSAPKNSAIFSEVFPACAGMFPAPLGDAPAAPCFPRVRGDVPREAKNFQHGRFVFPACAGMFRAVARWAADCSGFPRVRGDVPNHGKEAIMKTRFSPRARGCSQAY